jgi:chemotaxis protein MotB
MPKQVWIIASVLTAALVITLLGLAVWQRGTELDRLKAEAEQARAAQGKAENDAEQLRDKLADSQARIQEMEKEKEMQGQMHKSLEDELRGALESKDVTISKLQGKLTVNIVDRVMFDSGEADLKPDGESVLRKVAAILAQHPEIKIHVIGHTDNVPIRAAARSRFPSNWELSTARATAAVRFLTERAGVDPRRVGAVGYGEFRPIADNATAEGRAKNRRIAIAILSEEMAGADLAPEAGARRAAASTNAPPEAVAPPAEGK